MLLSKQIEELAADVQLEASGRPYIRALVADLCDNRNFWQIMLEILEIVLHRRGYLIVRRSLVEKIMDVPPSERKEAGI